MDGSHHVNKKGSNLRHPIASIFDRPKAIILKLNDERYSNIHPKGYRIKVPSLEKALNYLEELEIKKKEKSDSDNDSFDIAIGF